MSFIRPELAERWKIWRESALWGALLLIGLWLIWRGYAGLAPLVFGLGLICAAAGVGLLRDALSRARLSLAAPAEGVVVIDEARIGYLGPRDGGFVDLPAIVSVEIISRAPAPSASPHAWVIGAEDGTRLVIPLGARGAEALAAALSPLPGIDFDAGLAAIGGKDARRAVIWQRSDWQRAKIIPFH